MGKASPVSDAMPQMVASAAMAYRSITGGAVNYDAMQAALEVALPLAMKAKDEASPVDIERNGQFVESDGLTSTRVEPSADDVERAWLIHQLEAWPTRIDRTKTINIEYLMKQAAKAIKGQQSTVDEVEPLLSSIRTWVAGLPHDMESRAQVLIDLDTALSAIPGANR